MRFLDCNRMAGGALSRYPARTFMMLLATAIGVAAVLVLTSLGEAARRYVTREFQSLGTHLVIVIPGRGVLVLEVKGGPVTERKLVQIGDLSINRRRGAQMEELWVTTREGAPIADAAINTLGLSDKLASVVLSNRVP